MNIKFILIFCFGLISSGTSLCNQAPRLTEADIFTDEQAEEIIRALNTGNDEELSEETIKKLELFNLSIAPFLPELNTLAEEIEALNSELQN